MWSNPDEDNFVACAIRRMVNRSLAGDTFKHFRTYKYKCHFGKLNMEFGKSHPSTNSWLRKLYIQISVVHMSIVPGPASQDAVIKRVLASPSLQCRWTGSLVPHKVCVRDANAYTSLCMNIRCVLASYLKCGKGNWGEPLGSTSAHTPH
jgi:hypothetical protein